MDLRIWRSFLDGEKGAVLNGRAVQSLFSVLGRHRIIRRRCQGRSARAFSLSRSSSGLVSSCFSSSSRGGGMSFCGQRAVKKRVSGVASCLLFGFLLVVFQFADSPPAPGLPTPSIKVNALPAFARKYGMPCSSCHEAWPKLSPFGQAFKDNGYQMGNDRDAPIFQQPAYWPVTFRMTTFWHRESQNRTLVDGTGGPLTAEGKITTHGFD